MSSYLNVLLFSGHQVMDTFIKLILIICFKLHAGMVAVLQMLKGQTVIPHRTQHGVNWILIIFGITILTLYMLTDCALIVSGTLTLRLYGL